MKLLKYYGSKIQELCRAFGFPRKVQATALIFFKRVYLSFSCLDHDPKNIMLTCIYLAGKVRICTFSSAQAHRAATLQGKAMRAGLGVLASAIACCLTA